MLYDESINIELERWIFPIGTSVCVASGEAPRRWRMNDHAVAAAGDHYAGD
jgi:hypothetical protein